MGLESENGFILMPTKDFHSIQEVVNAVKKLSKFVELNLMQPRQSVMPFKKFCQEYELSYPAVYDYHKINPRLIKKIKGKTYVDVNEFLKMMVDFVPESKSRKQK